MATATTVDAPEVQILLLGDAEVGKSTFLSYVSQYSLCVSCSPAIPIFAGTEHFSAA